MRLATCPHCHRAIEFEPGELKRLRKRYGLSQYAAARLLGVHRQSWWNWERGDHLPRRSLAEIARRLEAALGQAGQDCGRTSDKTEGSRKQAAVR